MSNLSKIFASATLAASLALTAYKPECLPIPLAVIPLTFQVVCDKPKNKELSKSVSGTKDDQNNDSKE
jgi:hypothetical protein